MGDVSTLDIKENSTIQTFNHNNFTINMSTDGSFTINIQDCKDFTINIHDCVNYTINQTARVKKNSGVFDEQSSDVETASGNK